ncbi:hypothetical protein HYALB_00005794 [Hymenoscyphus albidus]|uniref:chitinase n=1 Tax=Hymenoscyphus albidus TaxID=595503 RepID=A0A9N9LG00_9HELO|nr:hypothetical protein HYALB_00005794 [Hymenoscyphus albidus]
MKFSTAASLGLAAAQTASARYVLYVDQYHLTELPNKTMAAGVDHVIMAFANSSLFTTSPPGVYTPFEPVETMRARFDPGTKVSIAIGGWGDTAGFSEGAKTEESRATYAANVADMLNSLGFDGVDCDWEYPAGNGEDYLRNPNSGKVDEIETYPLLLKAIKQAIGDKELSLAVPGKKVDMIAYTPEKTPAIWESSDFVNIMTYDIMNRRDNITKHHTSVKDSKDVVDYYLDVLALPAEKTNLGIAFYAKYFTTDPAFPCETGLGCRTVLLENPTDGSDTGKSGAMTFEKENYATAAANLTESPDGSCGAAAGHFCSAGNCCSSSGFCGNSPAHCGINCLSDYSVCPQLSVTALFRDAMANGKADTVEGGQYYFDAANNIFWTWDTPEFIAQKFETIIKARGLGGVMAWSGGEDSHDWSHLAAIQKGAASLGLSGKTGTTSEEECEKDDEPEVQKRSFRSFKA